MLLARLWRIVQRERVDVLHAHNYEAAIAALVVGRLTRRPVVYHGHSAHADELPLYASRPAMRRWLGRWRPARSAGPRRADCCIAVSAELGDRLRAAGLDGDDLVVSNRQVRRASSTANGGPGQNGVVATRAT
jgi:hypothetical protein